MGDNRVYTVRDLTIFMSYTGPVCQLNGDEKSICPVFTVREKVMVPFKVNEKAAVPYKHYHRHARCFGRSKAMIHRFA